jgi:hypothetical protein
VRRNPTRTGGAELLAILAGNHAAEYAIKQFGNLLHTHPIGQRNKNQELQYEQRERTAETRHDGENTTSSSTTPITMHTNRSSRRASRSSVRDCWSSSTS